MSKAKYDAIIEFRGNQTTLATLASFYESKGKGPWKNGWKKSDLIRQVMEDFKALLIREGLVKEVKSTERAVELLASLGYGLVTAGKRGQTMLAKSISKETIRQQFDPPKADENKKDDIMKMLEGEENGED